MPNPQPAALRNSRRLRGRNGCGPGHRRSGGGSDISKFLDLPRRRSTVPVEFREQFAQLERESGQHIAAVEPIGLREHGLCPIGRIDRHRSRLGIDFPDERNALARNTRRVCASSPGRCSIRSGPRPRGRARESGSVRWIPSCPGKRSHETKATSGARTRPGNSRIIPSGAGDHAEVSRDDERPQESDHDTRQKRLSKSHRFLHQDAIDQFVEPLISPSSGLEHIGLGRRVQAADSCGSV